jgi:hypothetical protein
MMSRSDFEGFLSIFTDTVVEGLAECSPSIWAKRGVARDLSFLASVINDYLLDSHPDSAVPPSDLKERAFMVGVGLRLVMRQAFLAAESKNKK